jgi:thiamine biosynthesis lipoprotein
MRCAGALFGLVVVANLVVPAHGLASPDPPSAAMTETPSTTAPPTAPAAPVTSSPRATDDPAIPTHHRRVIGALSVELALLAPVGVDREAAAAAAFDELERVERVFASDGPTLSSLIRGAGGPALAIEPEVFAVLVEVMRVAKLAKGAYDPSVAGYDNLWASISAPAVSADDSSTSALPSIPTAAALQARRALVGVDQLQLDAVKRTARLKSRGARIDVSAVARGYGLDRARGVLIERGATGFVLSSAGDVVFFGEKATGPWVVGLSDPRATEPFLTVVASSALGGAVMTAVDTDGAVVVGDVRHHRLLDPRSGEPGRRARSVAVFGGDALTAKCLARAIFVLGATDGLALAARHKGVEVVVVDAKNAVHLSPGLKTLAKRGGLRHRPPTDAP